MTRNLEGSALWLALWRVLRRRGTTPDAAGRLFIALAEAWLRFTPRYHAGLRRQAAASQRRRYPGDWVFRVVEGPGAGGDFGVDYTDCGIVKFFRAQGGDDILRYICPLDAPMSQALAQRLVRTTTLAEGGARCDVRYTRGGPTGVATPWDRERGKSACPGRIAGVAGYPG